VDVRARSGDDGAPPLESESPDAFSSVGMPGTAGAAWKLESTELVALAAAATTASSSLAEDAPKAVVSAAPALPVGVASAVAELSDSLLAAAAGVADGATAAPADIVAADAAMSHTVCAAIKLALAAASAEGARRPAGLAGAAAVGGVPESVMLSSARTAPASSASLSGDAVASAVSAGSPVAAADEAAAGVFVVAAPVVAAAAAAVPAVWVVAVSRERDGASEPEWPAGFESPAEVDGPAAAGLADLPPLDGDCCADFGDGFPPVAAGVGSATAGAGVPASMPEKLLLPAASPPCGAALRVLALPAEVLEGAVALTAHLASAARDRPVRAAHVGPRQFFPPSEPCR